MVSVIYIMLACIAAAVASRGKYDYSLSVSQFNRRFPGTSFALDVEGRHYVVSSTHRVAVERNSYLYKDLDLWYDRNELLADAWVGVPAVDEALR